jgi:hypothetical protein
VNAAAAAGIAHLDDAAYTEFDHCGPSAVKDQRIATAKRGSMARLSLRQ